MDKNTNLKSVEVDSNFTWAWQQARLRIYLSLFSTYYLNILNYGQIILNKHLFKRVFLILIDYFTLIWQVTGFYSMVHVNMYNIYFINQMLDWMFYYVSYCQSFIIG